MTKWKLSDDIQSNFGGFTILLLLYAKGKSSR